MDEESEPGRVADDPELLADLEAWGAGEAPIAGDVVGDLDAGAADDVRANRLLRARRGSLREAARIQKAADDEIAHLKGWAADRTAGLLDRADRLAQTLEGYMRALHAANPRVKSRPLPDGTLQLRAVGRPSVEVVDAEAALAWLKAFAPQCVRRTEAVAASAVLDAFEAGGIAAEDEGFTWRYAVTDDGERVPGIRLSLPKTPRFSIR